MDSGIQPIDSRTHPIPNPTNWWPTDCWFGFAWNRPLGDHQTAGLDLRESDAVVVVVGVAVVVVVVVVVFFFNFHFFFCCCFCCCRC